MVLAVLGIATVGTATVGTADGVRGCTAAMEPGIAAVGTEVAQRLAVELVGCCIAAQVVVVVEAPVLQRRMDAAGSVVQEGSQDSLVHMGAGWSALVWGPAAARWEAHHSCSSEEAAVGTADAVSAAVVAAVSVDAADAGAEVVVPSIGQSAGAALGR